MSADFNLAVAVVLKHEGGWVNDPVDPGGATNYGISLRYLAARGDLDGDGKLDGDIDGDGDVDWQDIKAMTVDQAREYYRTGWWLPQGYGRFNQAVATKLFDAAVNMGHHQAHKLAQRALRASGITVIEDGKLGPKTAAAIQSAPESVFMKNYRLQMVKFYDSLIAKKPPLKKYRAGWLRRALS